MEVALDIAFQCAPDHPWVTEHPEFFKKRPDGSIQYAENPPKRYQDIYPLDFESSNWQGLWDALKDVFSFWMDQDVKIFRVDNPHTKAFPFWQWVIPELKAKDPDVLFLAEAFTRPRVMERLAKLGFSQSYTYFTWRDTKEELTQYLLELTTTEVKEYFRPNFWPNTPDILPGHLQTGGLPAFRSRLVMATTMTSNYGIYGPAFELGENTPVRPGSEEYLNSEKYEIKTWDLENPLSLRPLITRLNKIRRENRALQSNDRLHFHPTDNPSLLCYSKRTADGSNLILVVVNLDSFSVQTGWVDLDLNVLGLGPGDTFEVYDLLTDRSYSWRGSRNYVALRPAEMPAHHLPGGAGPGITVVVTIQHKPSREAGLKQAGSAADPLWYKDAIIYELHVKAFMDGNNDGIGDFQGLLSKLDYVQDLGVTCLWLLPFFPSPLRDDGYDISDYLSVHPNYGTMEDFREFLTQAHNRGLQVMIELVINHTSDQHPWFQRARHAPKGSPERDFYVWSDTDQKYLDARIIFTDTEKSNWTWDPEAQQYYWHRFFSHQPDLNYDNPVVIEEVVKIMRYWLDMGVDGLRVDAIPYLVEREGTNCENLPETHAVMKRIRAEIDKQYAARTILAEANQWPDDVRIYYGDGDECHMAFHFPLMPRMYMALRQEDRLPITDIMAQTPEIPGNCQWGLFLRNHDELTLEMVSDDERDYMYLAYSADPRMRINIGIRRRLAPLVDNNRRRIELLNSLLFSFPGTPIVYYGDEIGMGDNIYLGDRNGVRTPMQWNGDRNAGFSRAVPAKLYSPVIMDPVWGYEALNVEAQQSDPSSLLSWMRNMIALRKLFQVFGRGTLSFLNPTNRKILAYIREYKNEKVLCVANLSRFAQPVELDLAAYAGMVPVEMLGYVEFPRIRSTAYPLTVGPYGFLWLELQPSPEPAPSLAEEGEPELEVSGPTDWMSVLEGNGRRELEESVLRGYLARQRWFGAKSRPITGTRIEDWAVFNQGVSALVWVEVQYAEGDSDTYLVTLGLLFGKAADTLREESPNALLARLTSVEGDGVLHEAIFNDTASEALLALISGGGKISIAGGRPPRDPQ